MGTSVSTGGSDARNALVFLLLAILVAGIHHVYFVGPRMAAPFLGVFAVPLVLTFWRHRSGGDVALWLFGAFATLIFLGFGVVDGILDHGFKAVGIPPITFFTNGGFETVPTYYNLWSPEAGRFFFEGTGVLTTILSAISMVFTVRVLRARRRPGFAT